MNSKFFSLAKEKQNQIINAAYRVFALNSYKKSPMSEIAAEAGISKSLLFHYFKNKRELYLFLWERAAAYSIRQIEKTGAYASGDFWEMMRLGLEAKIQMMRVHPYLASFVLKAFYESDQEVASEVMNSYKMISHEASSRALLKVNPECFRPGLDLSMMVRQMYWESQGCLWEMMQRGNIDVDELEREAWKMLEFWEKVYGPERKNGHLPAGHTGDSMEEKRHERD